MSKNREQLSVLQGLLIDQLIDKIKSGEATSSDLNVARQLCKDNDIVCLETGAGSIEELTQELRLDTFDIKQAVEAL